MATLLSPISTLYQPARARSRYFPISRIFLLIQVASRRSSEFADGLKGMSTLYNMSKNGSRRDGSACRNICSERAPRHGHRDRHGDGRSTVTLAMIIIAVIINRIIYLFLYYSSSTGLSRTHCLLCLSSPSTPATQNGAPHTVMVPI